MCVFVCGGGGGGGAAKHLPLAVLVEHSKTHSVAGDRYALWRCSALTVKVLLSLLQCVFFGLILSAEFTICETFI